MRQYELAIRIAQVHHLVDERKYKKALAVIQTLDMRQVRALSDLRVFAEVYTKTEQYDAAKATYLRIYRRSHTKRVLYRLIYLSIRTNALNDAEAYYQEFVRMSPNARDALILRYRIDKASGAPIGQLIDILQELKQEEYIEEWAYELAKLYHRAGRKEECKEECQDIILWFGMGEIVERARILIDHLDEEDANFYYDDKDFTVPKKEEPNPEDTGSLPDLNEYVKGKKNQKREERREAKGTFEEEWEEDAPGERDTEEIQDASASRGKEKAKKSEDTYADEFVDDYEDDYFDEEMDLSQKAKDGIHKLSGFLKLGKKEEAEGGSGDVQGGETEKEKDIKAIKMEKTKSASTGQSGREKTAPGKQRLEERQDTSPEHLAEKRKSGMPEQQSEGRNDVLAGQQTDKKKHSSAGTSAGKEKKPVEVDEEQIKIGFVPHSQSGMGITQDLAKEISAIYEMEQREQLKEKAVTVIHDTSNIATNVVERMTQAVQKNIGKSYIPLDIEEIQPENAVGLPERDAEKSVSQQVEKQRIQEGEAQVAVDEGIQEDSQQEQIEEFSEEELKERALTRMLEEEVAEIQKNLSREVILETTRQDTEMLKSLLEEEIADPEQGQREDMEGPEAVEMESVEPNGEPGENGTKTYEQTGELAEEVSVSQEEAYQEEETEETSPAGYYQEEEAEETSPAGYYQEEEAEETAPAGYYQEEEAEETSPAGYYQEEEAEETAPAGYYQEEEAEKTAPAGYYREEEAEETAPAEYYQQEEQAGYPEESATGQPPEDIAGHQASGLEGYSAPKIPVVETSYTEMPEITYEELPTTRALQQSFENVLKLIQGELDPSHFVLMGDGTERIVGVAKQIVRVMKATGYLSQGRIAKIQARQINKMDLISFRSQLKGNCLLIEGASDLLFPTITRLFSIMEEYYGDFVVILVDEGTTLDQLFRFVPALARKFKYIIDISKYTAEDYLI